jgi:hypothetical protein
MRHPLPTSIPAILASVFLLAAIGASGSPAPEEAAKAEEKPKTELSALEKAFQEALTNAVFKGRWRLVKDGALGEESEEKYTIAGVSKQGPDLWLVSARVQYGKKDVTVPIPVNVYWAGDTPVITLANVAIPGLGTYSARVMVHGGFYAGTWSGPGHAGFLQGVIEKARAEPGKG